MTDINQHYPQAVPQYSPYPPQPPIAQPYGVMPGPMHYPVPLENQAIYPPAQYNIPVPQPVIAPINNITFGPYSIITFCSRCNLNVSTKIIQKIGCMVWLMFFIFLFCCPILIFLPFILKQWFDSIHYCPRCESLLGIYKVL